MHNIAHSLSSSMLTSSGLAKMPREQRDTLFALGALFFILLPHFFYLPVWVSVATCITLLWRAWLTRGTAKLPGLMVKVALLAFFVIATFINYKTIAGPEAGGTLLVMLVSLKTLELRARRDAVVIFYLGFFLIMMSFFQSQNILTAAHMLIACTALITAQANAHMPAGYPPLKDAMRIAVRLMLFSIPLMLFLYLTFPRLGPLWGQPNTNLSRTGVSGELSINSISQLVQDESIAFRVKFDGNIPEQKDLYFRGPVLSLFNGRTWRAREIPLQATLSHQEMNAYFQYQEPAVSYEITMETTNQPWLFTLDITPYKEAPDLGGYRQAMLGNGAQWIMSGIVRDRLRYRAKAYLNYRLGATIPEQWLVGEKILPPGSNPRTRQWAEQLLQDPAFAALDPRGKAQWLLDYIRQENFQYTLKPPTGYRSKTAADQLWFEYRAGFCEHYASAFVVLMRAMDIPARIVTGYQGAEQNYVDNFWIVRQSNAHAWTEIWQPGEGWIRVDPTFAIAPHRINNGSLTLTNNDASLLSYDNLSFLSKFVMRWEALENYWNQWVLAYSTDTGIDLLNKLGIKNAAWLPLVKVLLGTALGLLLAAWLAIKLKTRKTDPWQRTYTMLAQKLKQAGLHVAINAGPRTLAQQIKNQATASQTLKQAAKLLLELEKLRYAPSAQSRHSLKELTRAVKQLRIS